MTETAMDNLQLLIQYQNGNAEALEKLYDNNMGLVRSIAKRFMGRGTDFEDLVQIGSVGLIKAANAFNCELGYEFSTYAFSMINGEIRRFLRDDGIVKVSRDTKQRAANILREREKYISEYGCEPRLCKLAQICNITTEEAVFCLGASEPVLSMNIAYEDSPFSVESMLGYDDMQNKCEVIFLREAIKNLSPLEKQIISYRYFSGLTQSETAKILGVTQVKVSRYENKAIISLRNQLK